MKNCFDVGCWCWFLIEINMEQWCYIFFFFCVFLYSCVLFQFLNPAFIWGTVRCPLHQMAKRWDRLERPGQGSSAIVTWHQVSSVLLPYFRSFVLMRQCVATRLGEKSPRLSPRATDTDRTADAVEKAASRSWRPGIGRKHGFVCWV